jgi:DnaA family protein
MRRPPPSSRLPVLQPPLKHQDALDFPPSPQTFATFVAGANERALTAVRELAAAGGPDRFVYLFGSDGSGRTHLLHAAVAAAKEGGANAVLANVRLLREATLAETVLVAVDDVHALDADAQVALFDLYNARRAGNGGMLLAGDRAPRDLDVREDLRTRIGAMLAFELHPLTDAERAEALGAYAARRHMTLDDAVIDYLLARVSRDLRALTALVDRIDRTALEKRRAVTVPLVREVLQQADGHGGGA